MNCKKKKKEKKASKRGPQERSFNEEPGGNKAGRIWPKLKMIQDWDARGEGSRTSGDAICRKNDPIVIGHVSREFGVHKFDCPEWTHCDWVLFNAKLTTCAPFCWGPLFPPLHKCDATLSPFSIKIHFLIT
ncbi:hypothetical protein Csa_020730 [Cucumis sativus]|nr:hypothetical protein Csa_020730 [Cucumis sativus]